MIEHDPTTGFPIFKPDGYTLLSAPPPPLVINQSLYQKLAFDPAKFEPIIVNSPSAERAARQSGQSQGIEPARVDRVPAKKSG